MTLTRKEAIDRCGIVAVNNVEKLENARLVSPTISVDRVEYAASCEYWDYYYNYYSTLTAVYYQSVHTIRTTEDFDALVWTVDHYEIV